MGLRPHSEAPAVTSRRASAGACFQSSSMTRNPILVVLRILGIGNHDAVVRLHTPAPQEVHHVRSLLGPASIYQVVLPARLHEHPVDLSHVYEADRQRTRGRRRSTAGCAGTETAGGGKEEQEWQEQRGEEVSRVHRPGPYYCLPSGLRRSIHSSGSPHLHVVVSPSAPRSRCSCCTGSTCRACSPSFYPLGPALLILDDHILDSVSPRRGEAEA